MSSCSGLSLGNISESKYLSSDPENKYGAGGLALQTSRGRSVVLRINIPSVVAGGPAPSSLSSISSTRVMPPNNSLPLSVTPAFLWGQTTVSQINPAQDRPPLPVISSSLPVKVKKIYTTIFPTEVLKIIGEYFLDASEGTCTYVKELINENPNDGYRTLAALIAHKKIDLVAFGITPKDIVRLAAYTDILKDVTFNIDSAHFPANYPVWNYNKILIEILHFVDIHHLRMGKGDLHLLGRACDRTKGLIAFGKFDSIPAECYKELSRIKASFDLVKANYWPDLTLAMGRESRLLEPSSRVDSSDLQDDADYSLRELPSLILDPKKLASMFTKDSICALPHLGLGKIQSSLFKDILKHVLTKKRVNGIFKRIPPEKVDIAKSVLINTYREHRKNNPKLDGKFYFMKIYCALFKVHGVDKEVQKTVNKIFDSYPMRSEASILYSREDRRYNEFSDFYTNTLKKANEVSISSPPEAKWA